MFADDFTPEQNSINQNLFEDNQEMLAAEVGALCMAWGCWAVESEVLVCPSKRPS